MKKGVSAKKAICCVPSTHWDREWYKTFPEFQFHLVELMDQVIELLKSGKQMNHFHADGYSALIEDYLAKRPEKISDVKKLAGAGKLEIGPWYIQGDMLMPSGEAMIKNLEIGMKTAALFGAKKTAIPYSPDAFGHSHDVPKILNHLGFNAYFFCRGVGNQLKKPSMEFIWESDDGSEVLALAGIIDVFEPDFDAAGKWIAGAYGLGMEMPASPSEFRKRIDNTLRHAESFMNGESLLMMCGCDHLLPQKHLKKAIAIFNRNKGTVLCKECGLDEFAAEVFKSTYRKLEKTKGELADGRFFWILNGTASSRAYLKKMNFEAQNILEGYVGPWAAFASLAGKFEYDKFIEDAWKLLLKNQAHDSLCGCSIDSVHKDMEQRYNEIFLVSEKLIERAFRICTGDTALRPELPETYPDKFNIGICTAVPWRENKSVEIKLIHPADLNIADYKLSETGTGKEISFETYKRSDTCSHAGPFLPPCSKEGKPLVETRIAIDAVSMPAYGYKILQFSKKIKPEENKNISGTVSLKNKYLSVKIKDDGTLVIKNSNGAKNKLFEGFLYFEDEADTGDEYLFIPHEKDIPYSSRKRHCATKWLLKNDFIQKVEVKVPLDCPVFYDESNRTRSKEKVTLIIKNTITLIKNSRRIDIVSEIENVCLDHRLKVCFALPYKVREYITQSQFGKLKRSAGLPENTGLWREKPISAKRSFGWLSFSDDKNQNRFVLMPKGIHEHAVEDNALKLTLLRAVGLLGKSAGPKIPTPDAQCLGKQTSEYSLFFPEDSQKDENHIWREYQSYIRAPKAFICYARLQTDVNERSFFELDSSELVLSSIEKSTASTRAKARVYNVSDKNTSVHIKNAAPLSQMKVKPRAILSFDFKQK